MTYDLSITYKKGMINYLFIYQKKIKNYKSLKFEIMSLVK